MKTKIGKKARLNPKSERAKLIDKVHAQIRRICLVRNKSCVCCGGASGSTILQGGHLIPAGSSNAVRFDLMNVFTQCANCNGKHRFNTAPFTDWFLRTYGQEEYHALVERSKQTKHYGKAELIELAEQMKELADRMEGK